MWNLYTPARFKLVILWSSLFNEDWFKVEQYNVTLMVIARYHQEILQQTTKQTITQLEILRINIFEGSQLIVINWIYLKQFW